MKLRYEPLLPVQRDLYRLPRGVDRFREYLRLMVAPDGDDLPLPLVDHDHLAGALDALLAWDADSVAAVATAEAQAALAEEPGSYSVVLLVGDDLSGASPAASRYLTELVIRFRQKHFYTHGWIAATLWASETYSAARVRAEVLAAILRASYVQRHGYAHTLHEMLLQEGCVLRGAGAAGPALAPDDLAYTRALLEPYRDHSDEPTLIAALFGDHAAHALGYPPLGLSAGAGLALALADGPPAFLNLASGGAPLPQALADGRHHLVQIPDDRVVGFGHDRGIRVGVDGQQPLGGLAAHHVLDGAAHAAGDVNFGRDARAGLADLVEVRPPAQAGDGS
jgi:hypothetical protein